MKGSRLPGGVPSFEPETPKARLSPAFRVVGMTAGRQLLYALLAPYTAWACVN